MALNSWQHSIEEEEDDDDNDGDVVVLRDSDCDAVVEKPYLTTGALEGRPTCHCIIQGGV
jgi:hypothetical protein